MKDTSNVQPAVHVGLHGQRPAIQVICLASGGGPSEDNVTGFLARSIGSEWAKGSLLAVDAGSHLAPITRMLEQDFPSISDDRKRTGSNVGQPGEHASASSSTSPILSPKKPEVTILESGAFAGLKFPNSSARANALHVLRTYVSTYLITHPHLDHISGFAINTAAFHATSRPKTLAALPSTVNAIKDHIFNDTIWPNLSDEDGGVGFVTFQRLKEGGDLMVGEGDGRGYIDVCDGLSAKAFKVSHGTCTKGPPSHRHRGSVPGQSEAPAMYNGSIQGTSQDLHSPGIMRTTSFSQQYGPGTPRASFHVSNHHSPQVPSVEMPCVVDSTVFFLRDEHTQREVLIFGDVEPDTISLSPRNFIVWQEAARKIAHGVLGGIFIECSYDDSQPDALLFGHLSPRHLIAELSNLAQFVVEAKQTLQNERTTKKRKRSGANGLDNFARNVSLDQDRKRSKSLVNRSIAADDRRRSSAPDHNMSDLLNRSITAPMTDSTNQSTLGAEETAQAMDQGASPYSSSLLPSDPHARATTKEDRAMSGTSDPSLPLSGIRIVIIHIKDTLKDGPPVSENILAELREHDLRLQEDGQGLGCEFVVSKSGESYWF